jgi:putative ABC transport system ATP-binding protein
MPFIEVRDLTKEYPSAVALRGVDMDVEKREWLSIVGPSGSGKSTLLNILGGLDTPSSGRVFIDGTEISNLMEQDLTLFRRERIGFVFQQSHLIPYLTAAENVMIAQFFHSIPDRKEAEDALKRVGLEQRLNHRPAELSGGEQQRVCIARALINNPPVLLADEPTGNLDRENSKIALKLLRTLHEEEHFTIILVTHDSFVSSWAERILTMEDGRVVKDEALY